MAELPAIPQGAFAPLDYSPYSHAASAMASAGQGIDKAMNDFAMFEKTKDKENLRRQAINDIRAKEPELGKVIRDDATVEEIGKGLSQLGTGMVYYQQMKALQAKDPNMTLPDESQFKTAIFKASPEAAKQLFDGWEKQLKEAKEGIEGKEAAKGVAETVKGLPPGATQQEIARATIESGQNLKPLSAQGTQVLLASGQKQTDIDKINAGIRIAKEKLGLAFKKAAQDKQAQESFLTLKAFAVNGNFQAARDKMQAMAKEARAEAEVLRSHGDEKAASEKEGKAQAYEMGVEYSKDNADWMQDFFTNIGVATGQKYPELKTRRTGDTPTPTQGNSLGLTPPPARK